MKSSWRVIATVVIFGISLALLPFLGLPYEKLDTSAFYINDYTPTPIGAVGPESIAFFGRDKATFNRWVWIGAQVNPLDTSLPTTYTWAADGQTTVTHTHTSATSWQSSNNYTTFSWGNYTWVRFRWTTAGTKTITLTASNSGGSISDSRTIILEEPPTVNITSSAGSEGQTGTNYTFTATVSPSTASTPVYYYWRATDHPTIWRTAGTSDSISVNWSGAGRKVIQVWIWNGVGWDQDLFTFNIPIVPPTFNVTTQSVSSGPWNNASTWSSGSVPTANDVVLVNSGHTVNASSTIQITSLLNKGTLESYGTKSLTINANSAISNTGSIVLGSDAVIRRTRACDGSSGLSPGRIKITTSHLLNDGLIGGSSLNGSNGGRGGNVNVQTASAIWNGANGVIRAGDGGDGGTGGGHGANVTLRGKPIDNLGFIKGGDGGNGIQCAGKGGRALVFGRDTTNHTTGMIHGGDGGNTTDNYSGARAGKGGQTQVWGKYGGYGYLVTEKDGVIRAGNGGDGHASATTRQHAGCGGNLWLMWRGAGYLNGDHRAGKAGTPAAGGRSCRNGWVFIDPITITLSSETKISGGDIMIYGDDNSTIELRNISENAISATNGITLAVGTGGTVDLRGNDSQILQAGAGVGIYADNIEREGDTPLGGLVGTNVVTDTSRILRNVSIIAPDAVDAQAGETVSLTFEIFNGSPTTDTFTLSQSNDAGWSASISNSTITVGGLESAEFTVEVTVPSSRANVVANEIVITAVSQADSSVSGEGEAVVSTESLTSTPPQGPANQQPQLIRALPDITVVEGNPDQIIKPFDHFNDPEGDRIKFNVTSNTNPAVVPNLLVGLQLGDVTQFPIEFGAVGETEITIQARETWSNATMQDTFKVTVLPQDPNDIDSDGVNNDIEDQVPNQSGEGTGDGNGDGIADSSQQNVASLPNSITSEYVTFAAASNEMLTNVQAQASPTDGPSGAQFPQGLFSWNASGVTNNTTITITLHTTDTMSLPNSYWKYGATPDNTTDHWYNFAFDSETGTGAKINGNTITLHFVDGQRGDSDLQTNGQIADPGGPAMFQPPTALNLSDFNTQRSKQWQSWLLLGMTLTGAGAAMIWRKKRE